MAYSLPIFSSSDGRTVIGKAAGIRSATVAIRRLIDVPHGFTLHVWERSQYMQEILDLPRGFVYSVSYSVSKK